MGGPAADAPADGGDGTDGPQNSNEGDKMDGVGTVVDVADGGDIILDVTFETSQETLKKSRKAALAASRKNPSQPPPAMPQSKVRVAYRVSLDALKKSSSYFSNLLSNPNFKEAKTISETHSGLLSRGMKLTEADAHLLPSIAIRDDDEATQAAGREQAFEDLLRVLHQKQPKNTRVLMSYAATLAIMADRFDCVATVSRSLNAELKFKWPLTSTRPFADESGRATEVERVLRQKILVSWLLNQPMRLHQASREMIIRGSSLWSAFHDPTTVDIAAAWWDLPEGLEQELRYRRECVLNTIASMQKHFLKMYASRERQCKLGYDSSAACDSFQFGQMMKFLLSKGLLFLVDFSPESVHEVPDTALLDITELLATLKQCPNYQLDKHHINCGLRIRVEPAIEYINAMLSANVVSIPHADWKRRRAEVAWTFERDESRDEDRVKAFSFTRAIASDQRLRYEGALYSDQMARKLFTADMWDWTPEA